jgi:hypothetical protein
MSTSNDGFRLFDPSDAELLFTLCQKGKLYDVEKWSHSTEVRDRLAIGHSFTEAKRAIDNGSVLMPTEN